MYYRSEDLSERDISSLCVLVGWRGSAVVAVAAAVAVVRLEEGGAWKRDMLCVEERHVVCMEQRHVVCVEERHVACVEERHVVCLPACQPANLPPCQLTNPQGGRLPKAAAPFQNC